LKPWFPIYKHFAVTLQKFQENLALFLIFYVNVADIAHFKKVLVLLGRYAFIYVFIFYIFLLIFKIQNLF
jgi:hypothetical protein